MKEHSTKTIFEEPYVEKETFEYTENQKEWESNYLYNMLTLLYNPHDYFYNHINVKYIVDLNIAISKKMKKFALAPTLLVEGTPYLTKTTKLEEVPLQIKDEVSSYENSFFVLSDKIHESIDKLDPEKIIFHQLMFGTSINETSFVPMVFAKFRHVNLDDV